MDKLLVIQTAYFGDVLLTTSLIELLHSHDPHMEIDLLVQPSRAVIFRDHPYINYVWTFDKRRKLRSLMTLIPQLRRQRYRMVINAHRHGSSGLIALLCGAKEVVGYDVHPLSRFFTHRIPYHVGSEHEVSRLCRLAQFMTRDEKAMPRLYPSASDYEKVTRTTPYITISPGSVWQTKQWPNAYWIELINQIPDDVDVLLLGGVGEQDLCEQIKSQTNRPVENLAGVYDFLESGALMQGAIMNYTQDSAPLHIASAMNAPVTAVFCSTSPQYGYGPLSQVSYVRETHLELPCRPCGVHGHRECPLGHFKCSQIDVAVVKQTFDLHNRP